MPTLQTLLDSRHEVVAVVSQPDRPKGRGHKLQPTPTKAVAADARRRRAAAGANPRRRVPRRVPRSAARPRRGRGVRTDPAGRAARDPAARHDQRARVAAAEVPRRGAGAPRGDRRPARDRHHDHARRAGARRRADAGHASVRPIGPDETSAEVERGARAGSARDLLLDVVEQLAAGTANEEPQDDARRPTRHKILKAEGTIDWTLPAARIHNLCAAFSPGRSSPARLDGAPATCSTAPRRTRRARAGAAARHHRRGGGRSAGGRRRRRRGAADPAAPARRAARDDRARVSRRPAGPRRAAASTSA